jgi:hypothetical protein
VGARPRCGQTRQYPLLGGSFHLSHPVTPVPHARRRGGSMDADVHDAPPHIEASRMSLRCEPSGARLVTRSPVPTRRDNRGWSRRLILRCVEEPRLAIRTGTSNPMLLSRCARPAVKSGRVPIRGAVTQGIRVRRRYRIGRSA